MDVTKIAAGRAVPADINVVIEIPANADPVKYELDKDSGAILVDRFVATPMFYPANYGFIPNTLGDDGDPVDVMVVTPYPVVPGSVIRARPVGVLKMEDESGMDEKILAVPHQKVSALYDHVQSYTDLPELLIRQIEHFFTRYKDLEKGKWVKVTGWDDIDTAKRLIEEGVARAGK
ncbi:MAG: inorganic diphosphatase [Tistrella sp.]|jgi:inorganic pyrophosphatase|uniref:Inorganic pyrophosphatase n=2 Tax=Tistrella mobilis TaxID=171437 RepID=I3TRA0_TISMK|nr:MULTISPECIES: inorganic diphosphatase [Tistrella]AFK55288.1 inorganic pyrophosphatase [Tistrella mobilis KA081020-065]KYO51155.1 inorganic pyrophosphatase [Tistrella mobilis]MAD38399.1 inorganic diphosphatase [Tistrella sp.]MAM76258.1 inorganic diphosphatase [Tistrella sp.]MBA78226.1 inorganic diphosphatase [Tistrella sp.]|tara:strand:+ start:337 stop:864 length:528 start_codon:yes stop_codon:yes gene_type:complete